MAFWLVKSEPNTWSWDDHVQAGAAEWDGVRNHQAKQNLMAMKRGDKAFFYHSGKDKQIVGIVKVVKEYYPDHTDQTGQFGMVDFKIDRPLRTPVTLAQIKADKRLADIMLIRNSRLSVMPISASHWRILCKMGGVTA